MNDFAYPVECDSGKLFTRYWKVWTPYKKPHLQGRYKTIESAQKAADKINKYGKFSVGKGVIFNPPPTTEIEAVQHGNALAASGNYPVGTSECFNVGIAGGCGPECFVYAKGMCDEPDEMLERLNPSQLELHKNLYK